MPTETQLKQIQEILGRIGGDFLRTYGRSALRLGAAMAGNIMQTWSDRNSLRNRLCWPAQWAAGKLMRLAPAKKPSGSTMPADIARLITLLMASFNHNHTQGAPGTDSKRGEKTRAFLQNMDFGEIMEMVEKSDPYVLKALETFNEELWKYPAKVGTIIATLIPLINILIKATREVLVPIEKSIGPDLLADILLSVVKGVNGADAARLITTLQEVLRRVHTGSLLLGKGGKPLMQLYLTDFLKACMPLMNPELTRKASIILAEDKLAIANALADALTDNPEIMLATLASLGSVKTAAVKARARRLRVYEDIDNGRFQAAASESLSDLDTYEIADLINSACRILNRIHAAKPDFLGNIVSGIADSLDQQDFADTAQWLISDLVQAIKPVVPVIMPALIKGVCELLNPDFVSAEQADALQTLKATLTHTGGEK